MSSDEQIRIDGLEDAIKKIASEIETLKGELSAISKLPSIDAEIKSIQTSISDITKKLSSVTKIDEVLSSVKTLEKEVAGLKKDKQIESINKKVDGIINTLNSFDSRFDELKISEEITSFDKKIDDVLSSVIGLGKSIQQIKDDQTIPSLVSKVDSLQEYVAGLSSIEERVDSLTGTFDETREIVSIIVRQLDDIERKYNKALNEVSEALALVQKAISSGKSVEPSPKSASTSKKIKKDKATPSTAVSAALPSTIDSIMEQLLSMVTPHTEAIDMARALEETRDKLTDLIKEHTPVIFQFGKIARELKSYPPTATLNENDIARLNKEIRSWTAKLKEVARG